MVSTFASENNDWSLFVIMASVIAISTVLISVSEALLLLNSYGVPAFEGEGRLLNSNELNLNIFLVLESGLMVDVLGDGRTSFTRILSSLLVEVFVKILAY